MIQIQCDILLVVFHQMRMLNTNAIEIERGSMLNNMQTDSEICVRPFTTIGKLFYIVGVELGALLSRLSWRGAV